MSKPELVQWLLENIKLEKTEFIQLCDIQKKLNGAYHANQIGKAIKNVFPNVKCTHGRSQKDWSKQTQTYTGLSFRDAQHHEIKFQNIPDICDETFFKIKSTDHQIVLGYFNGHCLNGNKLITEVIFNADLTLHVIVSGNQLKLKHLAIPDTFSLDQSSVRSILDCVKKMRLCSGICKENFSTCLPLSSDVSKEYWSMVDCENSGNVNFRSKSCKLIVCFGSKHNACSNCRTLLDQDQVTSTGNVKSDIRLTDEDHTDMKLVLEKVIEDCPAKFALFLKSELRNMQCSSHARRWSPEIIRICLTLYCRSPKGYEDLFKSGFVVLPSQRMLQRYKNSVNQTPGINKDVLLWMKNEACAINLCKEGYEGGIMIDEMSIQDDLQTCRKGDNFELVGFVDCTEESVDMDKLMTKRHDLTLANHVLQLVFLGMTGFRFPFAHFPTKQASASELYLIFWRAVKMLGLYDFRVHFVSLDGAQTNRDFMKMLLLEDSSTSLHTMLVKNVFDPEKPQICVIMDYSHVMKKIRNNVCKSGFSNNHKRKLFYSTYYIVWDHWIKCYQWDISTNPFPIHHKLTHDHFYLTSESKMRNKLAEDVLDKEMLHLMLCYQQSLGNTASLELSGTIELLRNTSVLVKNFRDQRPITDVSDQRLKENQGTLSWFQEWEEKNKKNEDLKNKEKSLISHQTREDIFSLITGFGEMCSQKFKVSTSSIVPSRVNSDVIENVFCQQRGLHNGANTNPTYLQYSRTMNTIILGQTSVSKKSNTGGSSVGADPFTKPKVPALQTSSIENQQRPAKIPKLK